MFTEQVYCIGYKNGEVRFYNSRIALQMDYEISYYLEVDIAKITTIKIETNRYIPIYSEEDIIKKYLPYLIDNDSNSDRIKEVFKKYVCS